MQNGTKLNTFPKSRYEALALLFLQAQDLSGKSPAEIQTMYFDALTVLRRDYLDKVKSGYFQSHAEE